MKPTITLLLTTAALLHAQMGRTLDWPTYAGDAQRTGWEKSDARFNKDNVAQNFQLLWKMQQKGAPMLLPPVIIGNLIGYRGFKELSFFAGSDDAIYVMDSDMNRMYWQTHFVPPTDPPKPTAACPGGLTAMPTLMPIGFRRAAPRPAAGAAATTRPAAPRTNPMFGPRSLYVISSDGMLRRVNVANGGESGMAFQVIPANARVSTLNIHESVIYTTTSHGCGGVPNEVFAIDLSNPDASAAPPVTTLMTKGGNFLGIGGPVIGNDGTVYVQTGDGPSDPPNGRYSNALLALAPGTLAPLGYFIDPAASTAPVPKGDLNSVTPVAFEASEGHDMIVSASRDGRLYLLDSTSLEKGDHQTPLATSPKIAPAEGGLWGGLTTWADPDGVRYVLATVWGKENGRSGSVAAFKIENLDSKPVFTPIWTVKDLVRPVPPVVASGVAFILSSGEGHQNAVLHAVDAISGQALWSTKDQVTAPGNLTGLTVANGRVYFVTADSTVWVFGIPIEL
jgi:outer membrane protein assembly factor BamB